MHRTRRSFASGKRLSLFCLCGLLIVLPLRAEDFGVLWIGNSLMSGYWTCTEGWAFVGEVMITPDSVNLGMTVRSAAVKRGATDIPSQWQQDEAAAPGVCNGIDELNSPTGCTTYGSINPWLAARSNYDYIALQGYRWDTNVRDTELVYCSRYYDLGLSNGTKPIVFACWQSPQTADAAIAIYDSLYRKYRSRGAIYAPVIQAHRLVWNDPTKDALTYLYDNDPYHHINKRGAWLMDCVFYEVFTGRSPVGITVDDLRPHCCCSASVLDSMSAADIAYCAAKAHQAVIDFYGAGNVPHLGIASVNAKEPVRMPVYSGKHTDHVLNFYDLRGKIIRSALHNGNKQSVFVTVNSKKEVNKILLP